MNQIFDMTRFGFYMRKYVSENRRTLVIYALELLLVPSAVLCFVIWATNPYGNVHLKVYAPAILSSFDLVWSTERTIFDFMFAIIATISAALYYNVLASKNKRVALFNTPASALEKSVTYFIIYVVCATALFFAGTIIADYVRLPLSHYYAGGDMYVHPFPLKAILPGFIGFDINSGDMVAPVVCVQLSVYLVTVSAYIMFSSVWPRRSFAKTTLLLIALTGAGIFLAVSGARLMHGMPGLIDRGAGDNIILTVMVSFSAMIAAIFTATGYARFKEWDVI